MYSNLRHQTIDNRARLVIQQDSKTILPPRKTHQMRATGSNRRHSNFLAKLVDSSTRKGSRLNPQGRTDLSTTGKNSERIKEWNQITKERAKTPKHRHREYTPRENAFRKKGDGDMIRLSRRLITWKAPNLRNTKEEINYGALTPSSKYLFNDKHGWEPSHELLEECESIVKWINLRIQKHALEFLRRKCRTDAIKRKARLRLKPHDYFEIWTDKVEKKTIETVS